MPALCSIFIILAGATTTGATVYLSPSGRDTNPGNSPLYPVLTPQRAADLAAGRADDTISVEAGRYMISSTLLLNSTHNGLRWICHNGIASFSGGVTLGPWKSLTPSNETLQLVQTSFPPRGQDRHLYVDQVRATRTRLSSKAFGSLFGPNPPWQAAKITDDGYELSGQASLPSWERDGLGAEFVFPQSTSPWTEPRCALKFAQEGSLSMMQPCWHNLRHKACGQTARGNPGYIENVGPAYITKEGEWAVNYTSGKIIYALRAGEEPSTIEGIMPVLEVILNITDAANIRFEGMLFEHATWLRPGQADGYVEQQTGCCAIGTNPHNSDCNSDAYWSIKSPGNLAVWESNNISFNRCEMARLGGVGLDFTSSQFCEVSGSHFHDISGSGIQIGSFTPNEAGLADGSLDRNNTVKDTIVTRAAVEYSGAAGINIGYTQGTILEHNEVSNLTYVGITVGWGWSRHECFNCTNAGWNFIRGNKVHDYKLALNDGGGIYMLGPQNGSEISNNWVHDQGTASSGALYPDEGSAYSTWHSNVVTNIGKSEWLHLWTGSIHNVTVANNFADTSVYLNHGTNCPMFNNTVFNPGQAPPAAQAIMAASGVRNDTNPWVKL